jgi:hypothetical protein
MSIRFTIAALLSVVALTGCGLIPARVRDGCYRFEDGAPLFKITGRQGVVLSKAAAVRTFRVGGWDDLAQKFVQVTPAFYFPGLPTGDSRRGNTLSIPSISYSRFAFDPKRDAFEVPVAAWGEEEVRLGPPC